MDKLFFTEIKASAPALQILSHYLKLFQRCQEKPTINMFFNTLNFKKKEFVETCLYELFCLFSWENTTIYIHMIYLFVIPCILITNSLVEAEEEGEFLFN